MESTLFLVSTMPCEMAIGAFVELVDPLISVKMMTINDAKDFCKTNAELASAATPPKRVIAIGTYWNECLERLASEYPETNFVIYCPGSCSEYLKKIVSGCQNVTCVEGDNYSGPATWTVSFLKTLKLPNPALTNFYVNSYKEVIRFIDDRFSNRNIQENQVFYTGIYNSDESESSMFKKFSSFFRGEICISTVLENGRVILNAQMLMARERALNNLKTLNIGGLKTVVTEAPDLVNLTHTELAKRDPDAKLSLVLGLKLGKTESDPDFLSYSWRPQSSGVNVSQLGIACNGDGKAEAAGGRLQISLNYKVVPDDFFLKS